MEYKYPFDMAIDEYISSLDENQRQFLRDAVLDSRAEDDWIWFEDVIKRYDLRDDSSALRRDINERVIPDPHGINSILLGGVGNKEPIHEATVFLDAVKEELIRLNKPA